LRSGKRKQPFCFDVGDGAIFAFAGLWDRWRAQHGAAVDTFTILTTTANHLLEGVHDRMPVILPPERYDLWLDPQIQDTAVMGLLRPFDAGCMRSYPVSARLNSVGNDDAECSTPIEPVAGTPSLFD